MNFFKNIENFDKKMHKKAPCVLTIGNFDGVHLGHDKIIKKVEEIAKNEKIAANLMSFFPHTVKFFQPQKFQNFLITTLAQKLKIFKNYSLENIFILHFNRDFAEISADDFVEKILVKTLNIKYLVIGYDFIFGKNREGNIEFLQKKSQEFGFEIVVIDEFKNGDETYSSSLVREKIREGNVAKAREILNRNFAVEGFVLEGAKMGREIGFKTVNIRAKEHVVQPKFGVYKSEVFVPFLGKKFKAITNFGVKPTVQNHGKAMFETHIFGFDWEIYGKKVCVELLDFVRPEMRFASLEELKVQIERDVLGLGV